MRGSDLNVTPAAHYARVLLHKDSAWGKGAMV